MTERRETSSRIWCALVFLAVLIAYWPALGAGFIWDDSGHVTASELRSLAGLFRIWFEPGATQQYYPVLHSAFWLESHLWGDAPLGYHLLNVLLHATNACLLAAVLRRLAIPGAWVAAFLFALHPVMVESVAWVSEQKNTLSTALYLCAALAYLRFDRDRRTSRYVAATVLFCLAVGAKTVAGTLPAALLVVFWSQRDRLDWRRDIVPLGPWFVLAAIGGLATSFVERTQIGASGRNFDLDFVQRCLLAGRALLFYLGKLVWPADLTFMYPRWHIDPTDVAQYLYAIGAVALIVAACRTRRRAILAAFLFFAGTLFPALGFVNVYPFMYSYVADHFQYLATIGIWALLGAGAARCASRLPRRGTTVVFASAALGLGALTSRQSTMYHDVFTLYETTLARNPSAWMAHNNLGIELVDSGHASEALPHYEAALKLRPDYVEAENNFGYALTVLERPQDALAHFDRAIQLRPEYAEAHNNRGIALMNLGRTAEGQAEFEKALSLRRNYPEAQLNEGLALANAGRAHEAMTHFAEAVRLRPDYAEAELNWAIGLALLDRFDEAWPHFHRATELAPTNPEAHHRYGAALARAGRISDAIGQYHAALDLNSSLGPVHLDLALALRQLGRNDEAGQELQEANRLGMGR